MNTLQVLALNVGLDPDGASFFRDLGEASGTDVRVSNVFHIPESHGSDVLILRARLSGPITNLLMGYAIGQAVTAGLPVLVLSDYIPTTAEFLQRDLSIAWSTITQSQDPRLPALPQFLRELATASAPRLGDAEWSTVERLHATFREHAALLQRLNEQPPL